MSDDDVLDYGYLEDRDFIAEPEWEGHDLWDGPRRLEREVKRRLKQLDPPLLNKTEALSRLHAANERRTQQAAWRQEVKGGSRSAAVERVIGVLTVPPPDLASMRVSKVLSALPGVGPTKTERMLALAEASPKKRLGGLTEGQRQALIHIVDDWANGLVPMPVDPGTKGTT